MQQVPLWRDFLFMRNVKLTIEYDGAGFSGWQTQNNGRSVQGELERALQEILQENVRVVGAGRTDAGVHARGQVAHCSVENTMDVDRMCRAVNALLPPDVVVHGVEEVGDTFHARYSATGRRYRYTITQVPVALGRERSWFVSSPLEIDAMQKCADGILGEHDFSAFAKTGSSVKHFRCTVANARWYGEEDIRVFDITSNRFLYGMVRALVGTMVDVGRGRLTTDDFQAIMNSKDRRNAAMAAPARGLVLEEVLYAGGMTIQQMETEPRHEEEE